MGVSSPILSPTSARRWLLCDWGGTVMEDSPAYLGPMVTWPVVTAVPQAVETIHALRADWRFALATNAGDSSPAQIEAALARVGLGGIFEHVFTPLTTGTYKPDRAFFQHALAALSIGPGNAVMVGDDLTNDVLGPRRAGIPAVWLSRGRPITGLPAGVPHVATWRDLADHLRNLA